MASRTARTSVDRATVVGAVEQYAGKTYEAEVLVTGVRQIDEDTHRVTLQWPHTHPFYVPRAQHYSPLLFVESVRQSLAVIAHGELEIPREYRMGWESLSSEIAVEALVVGAGPADVDVVVTHQPFNRRRLGSARLSASARVTRDGATLGTAHVNYAAYPPAIYERLRGGRTAAQAFARALPPAPPIAADRVGRSSDRDVVLAPGDAPGRWTLRADTNHHILFDHPHDHIPGMVLLEAACQAAQADAAPDHLTPTKIIATFLRYVELDLPCRIVAEPADTDEEGRRRQTVSGIQEDDVAFSVLIISEPPATT